MVQLLRNLGVKCDTDTTTELTPAQKFRHWCVRACVRPPPPPGPRCLSSQQEAATGWHTWRTAAQQA